MISAIGLKKMLGILGIPVVLNIQWGKAPTAALVEEAVVEEKDARILFVIYNETSTGALTKELPEIAKSCQKILTSFLQLTQSATSW